MENHTPKKTLVDWIIIVIFVVVNYIVTVPKPVESFPEILLIALIMWILIRSGLMSSGPEDENYLNRRAFTAPLLWVVYTAVILWSFYLLVNR